LIDRQRVRNNTVLDSHPPFFIVCIGVVRFQKLKLLLGKVGLDGAVTIGAFLEFLDSAFERNVLTPVVALADRVELEEVEFVLRAVQSVGRLLVGWIEPAGFR